MRLNYGVFLFSLILSMAGPPCRSQASAQAPNEGFKRFESSIVKLPPGAESSPLALSNQVRQRKLELHFALESNNIEELQARVARGETVSQNEIKEKYSGSEKDFKTLVSWLKDHGFQITQASADFTSVYAKASVAQIEKSLGVKMAIVTYKGKTAPAALTAPELPLDVGTRVIAIDGLQPFVQAVKHTLLREENVGKSEAQNPPLAKPAAATEPALKPKDILKAYNADGVGTGDGQEIAILIDTFPDPSDLRTFWQKNGLPIDPARIHLIDVQGPNAPLPAQEGEETLDTEWASGIAPEAQIRVYASGSLIYTYLDKALDMIFADAQSRPGLRQVSISLGLREDLLSAAEIKVENTIFLKLAAIGVTVFVSSGDAGSNPDATGHRRGPDSQVEYEASDPYTVSVGGTTLRLDRINGQVVSETGWADSGGGVSNLFSRPLWQNPYGSVSKPNRLVPDVSSVADLHPGAFVWFKGKEWRFGGTSWSAPTWTALCALIAEARQKQGKAPVFLAPLLYRLPANNGFRDITTGSNGAYSAGSGWDPVTGLGVPDVKALLKSLP